jgi:hypothetical protein
MLNQCSQTHSQLRNKATPHLCLEKLLQLHLETKEFKSKNKMLEPLYLKLLLLKIKRENSLRSSLGVMTKMGSWVLVRDSVKANKCTPFQDFAATIFQLTPLHVDKVIQYSSQVSKLYLF